VVIESRKVFLCGNGNIRPVIFPANNNPIMIFHTIYAEIMVGVVRVFIRCLWQRSMRNCEFVYIGGVKCFSKKEFFIKRCIRCNEYMLCRNSPRSSAKLYVLLFIHT